MTVTITFVANFGSSCVDITVHVCIGTKPQESKVLLG